MALGYEIDKGSVGRALDQERDDVCVFCNVRLVHEELGFLIADFALVRWGGMVKGRPNIVFINSTPSDPSRRLCQTAYGAFDLMDAAIIDNRLAHLDGARCDAAFALGVVSDESDLMACRWLAAEAMPFVNNRCGMFVVNRISDKLEFHYGEHRYSFGQFFGVRL